MEDKLNLLHERRKLVEMGGGEKRIASQHEKGKQTARERLHALLDPGSFTELDVFVQTGLDNAEEIGINNPGEGVVTGYGTVDGRPVYVYAQDFTVAGGSLGELHAAKICKVMDLAMKTGAPCIGLNDSGGARIQEGVKALNGYGEIFYRNTIASGVIPQISVIMGPCAGGAVYSPAITDFIFMVEKTSQMFITGPQVIKAVTGEEVTAEALGGAETHNKTSGVAHFKAADEDDCMAKLRRLLSFLPSNNLDDAPVVESVEPTLDAEELPALVPDNPNKPYDVRDIITRVVDGSDFFEVHETFAQNAVIGFARLGGRSVGIVANQAKVMAGVLDIDSSDKISRFVRFCDCFNIPLVTFVDVPGYLPGVTQEYGGIIRHGAKVLYAYSEATVPKISVILRKAYGGSYIAMSARCLRADLALAWPTAEIAVMGPEGAANIVYRKEIDGAADPAAERAARVQEYRDLYSNPYIAAARGWVDDVIDPRETRRQLINSLQMLANKQDDRPRKKHGNIPL
ncbi:MAG: carboxyl transferase domain-containing protein [Bacillota bacterium]|nr:carboxyl transferase domain-containing protein [Bacillota bacterium]